LVWWVLVPEIEVFLSHRALHTRIQFRPIGLFKLYSRTLSTDTDTDTY